jgi:methyl-accepting chemotaxis protein-1 (serine sensor receptor)
MSPLRALRALRSFRISRLQAKLLGIVAAGLAIAVVVALAALTRVYGTAKDVERISREDFETQLGIVRSEVAFKTQVHEWQSAMLDAGDKAMLENHWNAFVEAEKSVHDFAADARASTRHPEVAQALDAFLATHATIGESWRRAFDGLRKTGDVRAAAAAAADLDRGPAERLEEAEAIAQEQGSRMILRAIDSGTRAYRIAIGTILVASLAAVIAVWVFTRRALLAPIAAAAGHAERIARGDLTAEIRASSRDEAGQLLAAIGRMNDGLADVVSQVRASAEAVVNASGEVSAGMTDLSQRTEEQASSLEETAASMEELSSTVRQNADNAREADELASTASKRAEQGGREVARVVVTMSDISDSARRIADIISVIDGIAFQTNILALNAAVEAARAGEQGRGFAVVASEVRSLAQRSADAAREIKDLIGASVAKVEDGTRLVDQAGGTIAALVGDVKRVSTLMRSIAEASSEQSRGVQQVGKTVTEMDRVVQQNAAAVQQSAAAAEGMRRQADALLRAVSAFRLGQGYEPAPEPASEEASMPAPIAPQAAAAPARARAAPQPALAAAPGDEWQEF